MITTLTVASLENLLDRVEPKAFLVYAEGYGFLASYTANASRSHEQRCLSAAEKHLTSKGLKVNHINGRLFVRVPPTV